MVSTVEWGEEMSRINIKQILNNPKLWKEMCVRTIIATQAREGIETTQVQAEAAFDKVREEKRCRKI